MKIISNQAKSTHLFLKIIVRNIKKICNISNKHVDIYDIFSAEIAVRPFPRRHGRAGSLGAVEARGITRGGSAMCFLPLKGASFCSTHRLAA